jgi:hypothetical protein
MKYTVAHEMTPPAVATATAPTAAALHVNATVRQAASSLKRSEEYMKTKRSD